MQRPDENACLMLLQGFRLSSLLRALRLLPRCSGVAAAAPEVPAVAEQAVQGFVRRVGKALLGARQSARSPASSLPPRGQSLGCRCRERLVRSSEERRHRAAKT